MQHKSTRTYRTDRKPNETAKRILLDFATKACKAMGGAAQIGDSQYWIVDSETHEIRRK